MRTASPFTFRRAAAYKLLYWAERIDERTHSWGFSFDILCELANVSYGWGPDAVGWDKARRISRWAERHTR